MVVSNSSPPEEDSPMAPYDTALVVGRAFALANGHCAPGPEAAHELCRMAGNEVTLLLAEERFGELLARRPTIEDQRAYDLLRRARTMMAHPACSRSIHPAVPVG